MVHHGVEQCHGYQPIVKYIENNLRNQESTRVLVIRMSHFNITYLFFMVISGHGAIKSAGPIKAAS
jgi:hypothetical protein